MVSISRVVFIVVVFTTSAAVWIARAAEPVVVERLTSMSGAVESIDLSRREVWIRNSDGLSVMIEVPPEVRNLGQLKVGDKVVVRYHESVAAAVKPKGSRMSSNDDQATSAAPQTQPHVFSTHTVSTTAVIQSVDRETYSVAFKDADGFNRNATVTNPDARKFVATLKEGDQVEITYTAAVAVSVERK